MQSSPEDHFASLFSVGNGDQGVVLVKDTLLLSAQFVIQLLLRQALTHNLKDGDCRVVLVAVDHPIEHYKAVLRKMGIANVQQQQDAGLIRFVRPQLLETPSPLDGDLPGQLQQLFTTVAHAALGDVPSTLAPAMAAPGPGVRAAPGGVAGPGVQSIILIVDCLTTLSSLKFEEMEWQAFLHHCTTLGNYLPVPFSSIVLAHADVPTDEPWITLLEHAADVVIDVASLEGRTADIDGQVTILHRRPPGAISGMQHPAGAAGAPHCPLVQESWWPSSRLYFRAGELSIKWIPQMTGRHLL